ncbi:MAG: amidohydrolase family protein, partial [Thermoplasmatota archaeon]
ILTKTKYRDPTKLPAWDILKLGCIGGASVLDLDEKIGSLEEGKYADIITVDLSKVNLTPSVDVPFHNFVPNLVYSSTGFEVNHVFIAGKHIMRGGKFININERRVVKEAQERAVTLFKEAENDWERADSYLVNMTRKGLL